MELGRRWRRVVRHNYTGLIVRTVTRTSVILLTVCPPGNQAAAANDAAVPPLKPACGMVSSSSMSILRNERQHLRNHWTASLAIERESSMSFPQVAAVRMSKRRAALIGAIIGAGSAAVAGALYCRADCGGGPKRGALVFAPFGAGIGGASGLLIILIRGH